MSAEILDLIKTVLIFLVFVGTFYLLGVWKPSKKWTRAALVLAVLFGVLAIIFSWPDLLQGLSLIGYGAGTEHSLS